MADSSMRKQCAAAKVRIQLKKVSIYTQNAEQEESQDITCESPT